ncbi:MAG: hypothetical protein K2Z80_24325 [Xanthobacteraceae bacterium]|nr:hypothetical protein [Xanthobacteraceae bacterium]
MVRYVTPAEYQRLMRERQRAIDDYNRKVRQHNENVSRNVERYNREATAHNREVIRREQERIRAIEKYNRDAAAYNREVERNVKRAVDNYNQAIRAHNTQVRANEERRRAALQRLQIQPVSVHYKEFHNSTIALNGAFERLEQNVGNQQSDADDELILELPGQESANSLEVMNALLEDAPISEDAAEGLRNSELNDALARVSPDLDARWRGALFALI